MSWPKDINPTAPSTSLTDLRALVNANAPLNIVDGSGTWVLMNCTATTRNSKDCFQFGYLLSGTTWGSLYVYFNRQLIGVFDYPILCAITNFPYPNPSSAEGNLVSVNGNYIANCISLFGWTTQYVSSWVGPFGNKSWGAQFKIIPSAGVQISPGIKYFETQWAIKYSNVDANVPGGPDSMTQSTSIAGNYQVVGQGSANTFQNDFNTQMAEIIGALSAATGGQTAGTSLANIEAKLEAIRQKFALLDTLIDVHLGDSASPNSLFSWLGELKTQISNLNGAVSESLSTVVQRSDVQGIGTRLTTLDDTTSNAAGLLKNELAGIRANLDDVTAGKNLAEKTGSSSGSVDTTGLETKLGNIVTALKGAADGKSVADAVTDKTIPVADVSAIVSEIASAAGTLGAKSDVLASALPGAGGTTFSWAADAFTTLLGSVAAAVTSLASGAAGIGGVASFLSGNAAVILAAMAALRDLLQVIKDVGDLLHGMKMDFTGDAKTVMEAIRDNIEHGLTSSTEPYLRSIRDGLGWKAPPAENLYEDSVRGQLKRLVDSLYITPEGGGDPISVAETLATFSVQVKWGDVKFSYP